MANGIVIGLSALAGVWLGWWAVPICASIVTIALLIEREAKVALLVICVLAATIGAIRSGQPTPATTNDVLLASNGAIGRVDSFPRPSGDGHRVTFRVSDLCIEQQCVPADETVILYVSSQNPPTSRGQTLQVYWRLEPTSELPSGYARFLKSQGASASARTNDVRVIDAGPKPYRWLATANASISGRLAALLPGDTGALATGIVTGDDSALSNEALDIFRSTGTAHVTAVSGQNVTIILGFLSFWWQPRTPVKRVVFHVGLLLVIWSYAILVGLEPPALRAALVASLLILGKHVGRKPDPVTLLAVVLGTMALINPEIVDGLGFWLSATASFALCLALPQHLPDGPGRRVIEIAFGPIAASLATMPIVLSAFGTWSPVSILANMLLAPVITIAFWFTYPFAVLAIPFPAIAELLAWIPGIVLDFALVIVSWLAPISGQIRVDSLSSWAMLLLWLPIGGTIWLISGESDRWIRSGRRTLHKLTTDA